MPILPELVPMLDRIDEARAHMPDPSLPAAERRQAIHRAMAQRGAMVLPAPPVGTSDHQVPVEGGTITIRAYRPPDAGPGPLPVHLYIQGGGWWLGELDHRDALCAHLATDAGCVVVSVAHRLAPEHPFPIPVHDCHAALLWTAEHAADLGVDATRISIGGASSGANLAAATTLMARDRGGPALVAQVLDIPALDLTMSRPSAKGLGERTFLSPEDLAGDIARYCSPDELRNPYASPLLADDLRGLPQALIMTAEYDILQDDGAAYARRLSEAGVPSELVCWPGHMHGSHEMTAILESARDWQARGAAFLREVFAARHPGERDAGD
jgi:acetyl esterase